jgi:DNA-binding NarL/FixJ family response regulator
VPIRVVVADDDVGVRSAEIDLLEADGRFEIVAAVGTADDAVAAVRSHGPDIVLLDIRMPGGGLRAAEGIRDSGVTSVVTVISARMDAPLLADLLHAGVRGVFIKGELAGHLPDLLVRCGKGEVLLSTTAAARGLALYSRSLRTNH